MKNEYRVDKEVYIALFGKNLGSQGNYIPTSTGDIGRPYCVVDTVFAIDSDTAGLLHGVAPSKAFDRVKSILRDQCKALGGDAVIFCQFQYRNALDGKKQVIEIFAYGTVVKYI